LKKLIFEPKDDTAIKIVVESLWSWWWFWH